MKSGTYVIELEITFSEDPSLEDVRLPKQASVLVQRTI